MEHRQRKRLRVEELECRRLLHADFYGPVQLEIESITHESAVFVSVESDGLAVSRVEQTRFEGDVLSAAKPLGRTAGGQSTGTLGEFELTIDETKKLSFNSSGLQVGGPVSTSNAELVVRTSEGQTTALTVGPTIVQLLAPLKSARGPKIDLNLTVSSYFQTKSTGETRSTDSDYSERQAATELAAANESRVSVDSGSSEPSTAAEIAAAQGTLTEANGPEAGDGARRTEAQLRNVPAASSSQNRALTDSAEAAPLTSSAPHAGRPDSLPQAENDTPPVPDTRAEEAANESSTENTAPSMKLASAVWFALGQLPVVAAIEPLRPEGPALVQDLLYADWDAVEQAIDEMLVELRTGIAGVTPQNVRDAVFASSAAVLAAFAGEAARRRQQRLKDEELLALAFDADGHLALV